MTDAVVTEDDTRLSLCSKPSQSQNEPGLNRPGLRRHMRGRSLAERTRMHLRAGHGCAPGEATVARVHSMVADAEQDMSSVSNWAHVLVEALDTRRVAARIVPIWVSVLRKFRRSRRDPQSAVFQPQLHRTDHRAQKHGGRYLSLCSPRISVTRSCTNRRLGPCE